MVETRFSEIWKLTREYNAKISEIESASTESTSGLKQVRDAIGRLDLITQRTAAAAEENASASTELNAQMEDVFSYIETLEAMVSQRVATKKSKPGSSDDRKSRDDCSDKPTPRGKAPQEAAQPGFSR